MSGPRLARAALYALHERHPKNHEIVALLLEDKKSHFSGYLVARKLLGSKRPLGPRLCKYVWDTLQLVKFDASAVYFQVPPALLKAHHQPTV